MNFLILATTLILLAVGQNRTAPNHLGNEMQNSEHSAECPDDHPWTGTYENYNYHFVVVIPQNLKGYWNSAACSKGADGCTCMQDHGRIIPLASEPHEPERHIEVYAGYSTVDEDTRRSPLEQEVEDALRWIRKRTADNKIEIRRNSRYRIAGLEGRRIVVRYFDKELRRWQIEDRVEVLRGEVKYSLYLRTREEHFRQDLPIFTAVLSSFTLRNPE